MARELDTAQRRAEAMVAQYEVWVKQQPAYIGMPTKREKDKLTELFLQTRRDALDEASQACKARTIADVEGDWDRGHNMAVQNIANALDRLREGVGK